MARKSNTRLQKQGKVRGITNREIDVLKDSIKHFSFAPEEKDAPKN